MSSRTSIEWAANADGTPGATWNPIRAEGPDGRLGFHCVHASEGCRNCYAERLNMSPRFPTLGTGLPYAKQSEAKVRVFLDAERLAIPLRRRKPTTYFLASMTDVFADFVTDDMLDRLFAAMALAPRHTFIVLTKRAERMREYFSGLTHGKNGMVRLLSVKLQHPAHDAPTMLFDLIDAKCLTWPLPNVWLVVSVEDQANADARIPHLLATPAAVRGVSCEPLLGPLILDRRNLVDDEVYWDFLRGEKGLTLQHRALQPHHTERLDWIICGGESGPNARPMHPAWARSLREQCAAANVPFFFKQWGEWAPLEVSDGRDSFWPIDIKSAIRLNPDNTRGPDGWPMQRVGKARAGRLLDGVEHNARAAFHESANRKGEARLLATTASPGRPE